MNKQTRWQLWGKEPGDTEQVFLAEYLQKEWAEEAKQQAEQSGIRDVEIRAVEEQKPASNPTCPTCKGEGVIDLPFGGCQPCPDCMKQES